MSDFVQKLLVAGTAIAVGVALILFGLLVTHRMVWSAAGAFFATVGVSALALTFAPTASGPVGRFLRSPGVSVLILAAVGSTLCYTLLLGAMGR